MQLADIHKTLQWKTHSALSHLLDTITLKLSCHQSADQVHCWGLENVFSYLHISGETKQMGGRHLWNIQHLLPSRTTTGCFKFLIDLLCAHIMMYERLTMYENIYQSTVNLWRKNRAISMSLSFASKQIWMITFKTSHVLQYFTVSILKMICSLYSTYIYIYSQNSIAKPHNKSLPLSRSE